MHNIEIKVRVSSHAAVRARMRRDPRFRRQGNLAQVDTYYFYPKGRLKIRVINRSRGELILYERKDVRGSKTSEYKVVPIPQDRVRTTKKLFERLNGIDVEVRKLRELWMFRHTRIHLDTVQGLGTYLELETVLKGMTSKQGMVEHKEVITLLGLKKYKAVPVSYSDLLRRR